MTAMMTVAQKITVCRDAWNALNAEAAKSDDDSGVGKDRLFACEQRWEKAQARLFVMAALAAKGELTGATLEAARASMAFARDPDLRSQPEMREMLLAIACAAHDN